MTHQDMIEYINSSLAQASLKLSEEGEKSVAERFKKSEKDGGYSTYWKETSLEDAIKLKGNS